MTFNACKFVCSSLLTPRLVCDNTAEIIGGVEASCNHVFRKKNTLVDLGTLVCSGLDAEFNSEYFLTETTDGNGLVMSVSRLQK